MSARWAPVLLLILVFPEAATAQFTVAPLDEQGSDGVPDVLAVDSPLYKFRFLLNQSGSADSMLYKPRGQELRAENYYGNQNRMFRDWVRLAEPDPVEGFTRPIGNLELRNQCQLPAKYGVVRQDAKELVVEFEMRNSAEGGPPWMEKIISRRRLTIRADSPAIRVENELANTDSRPHAIVFDVFNGLNLGRVQTWISMPGLEGKIGAVDSAEERSSSFIHASEVSAGWIGGVNEQGFGGAFSFDWADVDGMQACMYKTVGSCYAAVMRRREIPAGQSIRFVYTFMPFSGFGAFDGMEGDLAGGILVGEKANYIEDVVGELKPGAVPPIKVFLASGVERQVQLRVRCVRQEDQHAVLEETQSVSLKAGETATASTKVALPTDGLYVLAVTAEGGGAALRMEKPIEVGKTRLTYKVPLPSAEKRGVRDAAKGLGPARADPQFKTLDPSFVTPHLPLLKGSAAGPIRAYFLTPADSTLGHVREICQRADILPEYSAITKITIPKYELHAGELDEFRAKLRAKDPQVLMTMGIDWHLGLKRKLAREILAKVRDGLGVVIAVRDLKAEPEIQEALAEAREVTGGPLPSVAVGSPTVRRFFLGRGRIVLLETGWALSRDEGRFAIQGWPQLKLAGRDVPVQEIAWRGFEYNYAMLGQWIAWAADRSSPITVTGAALKDRTVTVHVHNAGEPIAAQLRVAARSRRWEPRGEGETAIEIPKGESRHPIAIGSVEIAFPGTRTYAVVPRDGPLALEISIENKDAKLLAFGSVAANAGAATVRISPELQYVRAGRAAKCLVEAKADVSHGCLQIGAIDRFDRVVWQRFERLSFAGGVARVEFSLEGFEPLGVYHEVLGRLFTEDRSQLLAEGSAEVLWLPVRPPYADRFMLGVWGAPERDVLMIQAGLRTARDVGFSLHSHSYDDRLLYRTGGWKTAMAEVSPKVRYAKPGEQPKLDSENLVMHPPLLPDPAAIEAVKIQWQKGARQQYETGAWMLGLDDERRMSGDFDFNPQTLAGFRAWLRGRYPDIASLNKTWGSQCADFSQVMPKRRGDLGDSPNLAPWLDFRMYIGEVLGEHYMRAPARWATEISTEISVAEWGIYEPSATWPVDWSRYADCYRFTSRYGDNQGVLEELFRSFAPQTRHGMWMGYGMRDIDPSRRIALWQALLKGGNFAFFWELRDPGSLNYALCTSDQRATAGYVALARDEVPDLTGGIDRLVIASRPTDDGIAMAYSYPSWLIDSEALGRNAKVIVEELGFQHRYVSMDNPGGLSGARLLVLQEASCLSPDQAGAVRKFVEQGGTLVCVGRVGWRDLHGAPHAEGSLLDPLAGVVTSKAAPLGRLMATQEKSPRTLFVALKDVSVGDAKLLAAVDLDGKTLPVWTVKELGRGRAYWLNTTLGGHQAVHHGGAAGERSVTLGGPEAVRQAYHDLFEQMIASAGIKPRCRLFQGDKPIFDAETWYYQSPSGRTQIVARYLNQKTDGPLRVRLDRRGHVYDLRGHKYFGQTDAFDDAFPPGHMAIYAVLEYRVSGMKAQAARDHYKPGETVVLAATVTTEGKPADLHAFRLRVTDPQKKPLPAHDAVLLAPDGRAEFRLPLALNHPPGQYEVTVTDAFSGASAIARFEVTSP